MSKIMAQEKLMLDRLIAQAPSILGDIEAGRIKPLSAVTVPFGIVTVQQRHYASSDLVAVTRDNDSFTYLVTLADMARPELDEEAQQHLGKCKVRSQFIATGMSMPCIEVPTQYAAYVKSKLTKAGLKFVAPDALPAEGEVKCYEQAGAATTSFLLGADTLQKLGATLREGSAINRPA